jgi:DNA polymerase III delta prime subunit
MKVSDHFDKDNLHHAYLIEGMKDEILPEVFSFVENLKIKTVGNPDFYHTSIDNFKIQDALNLRNMGSERSFSNIENNKKIFVLCINRFTGDAQGVLLKIFEEPIENTHFFIITPSVDNLFRTFVSRFYLIKAKNNSEEEIKNAKTFIALNLKDRLDFIKDKILLKSKKESNNTEEDEDGDSKEESENNLESNQTRALRFLDNLEFVLNKKNGEKKFQDVSFFEQIFKAREFIRQPGSSAKMLLESVALSVPVC